MLYYVGEVSQWYGEKIPRSFRVMPRSVKLFPAFETHEEDVFLLSLGMTFSIKIDGPGDQSLDIRVSLYETIFLGCSYRGGEATISPGCCHPGPQRYS